MPGLEELQRALAQNAAAGQGLKGLEEQQAQAMALRGAPQPKINQYGDVSPLSVIANMMRQSQGRKQTRELKPQIEQARAQVAEGEHALPLFKLQQEQEKANAATARQVKEDAFKREKFEYEQAQDVKTAATAAGSRDRATYYDPTTGDPYTVAIGPKGKAYAIDDKGKETPVDITNFVTDATWSRLQKEKATKAAKDKRGGLTAGQLQTGLDKFDKKIAPVEDIIQGVQELDKLIAPYMEGGEKEGGNVPGIGLVAGQQGTLGDVARLIGGEDSQAVGGVIQRIIGPIIRNQAGLAQTMSETDRVLRSYGLQNVTRESVFLDALPALKKAIQADLQRLRSTTLAPVVEHHRGAYTEGQAPIDALFTGKGRPKKKSVRQQRRRGDKETTGGLSAAEAAELAELEKQFGGGG